MPASEALGPSSGVAGGARKGAGVTLEMRVKADPRRDNELREARRTVND